MKSLKELNEKCIMIAEFNNPAFVTKENSITCLYTRKTKCAIYSNKKGKYYVYKYINKAEIKEYENYEIAAEEFNTFVSISIER